MTFEEFDKLKSEMRSIESAISYNCGLLESRWLERKYNKNDDITSERDNANLSQLYDEYDKLKNIVKKYIK